MSSPGVGWVEETLIVKAPLIIAPAGFLAPEGQKTRASTIAIGVFDTSFVLVEISS